LIGGKKQLAAVIGAAINGIDERYIGYRSDLAKAIIEIVATQETSATDGARRDRIQTLVESLGLAIATSSETAAKG